MREWVNPEKGLGPQVESHYFRTGAILLKFLDFGDQESWAGVRLRKSISPAPLITTDCGACSE